MNADKTKIGAVLFFISALICIVAGIVQMSKQGQSTFLIIGCALFVIGVAAIAKSRKNSNKES